MAWLSDEEYVFQQDIKEKKSAGRGAFHKKCGSKSNKCTLPSDRMTKKEREAMNGEVFHYDPRKWYTWEEFKAMPIEYQVKYVNSLLNRYDCGLANISCIVFGKSKSWLSLYFKKHGQREFINAKEKCGGSHYTKSVQKLREDMEKSLWPNHDEEIQNESDEVVDGDESKELTVQEKIKQAQDTVNLYESRGMPITPELINQIYEEKTGMSFAMAMEHIEEPIPSDPVVMENEPEDSTDVKSFSIVMDHIDMGIIQYVSDLFKGKKIAVSFEVKEAL